MPPIAATGSTNSGSVCDPTPKEWGGKGPDCGVTTTNRSRSCTAAAACAATAAGAKTVRGMVAMPVLSRSAADSAADHDTAVGSSVCARTYCRSPTTALICGCVSEPMTSTVRGRSAAAALASAGGTGPLGGTKSVGTPSRP